MYFLLFLGFTCLLSVSCYGAGLGYSRNCGIVVVVLVYVGLVLEFARNFVYSRGDLILHDVP